MTTGNAVIVFPVIILANNIATKETHTKNIRLLPHRINVFGIVSFFVCNNVCHHDYWKDITAVVMIPRSAIRLDV